MFIYENKEVWGKSGKIKSQNLSIIIHKTKNHTDLFLKYLRFVDCLIVHTNVNVHKSQSAVLISKRDNQIFQLFQN